MTHDEIARELYQKDKDNIAPVVEVANHYYCRCCDVIIDRYKANYCYNCGKKLDWNKVERSFSNACTARFYNEE